MEKELRKELCTFVRLRSDDVTRLMTLKRFRRNILILNLRWYFKSCLERLRNTTKCPSERSVCWPGIELRMSHLRSRILTHSSEMLNSTVTFVVPIGYIRIQTDKNPRSLFTQHLQQLYLFCLPLCHVDYHLHYVLRCVRKTAKMTINFVLSVYLSVLHPSFRHHGTTRLPLDGFSRNVIFEYFARIWRENASLILNLTRKMGTLREHMWHLWSYLPHVFLEWEVF